LAAAPSYRQRIVRVLALTETPNPQGKGITPGAWIHKS
jgi:hypothetical protein